MQRLKGDRGAVGVMVALLMVPLLVCSALVVDLGSAYVRRLELQNAADAGALAIAQDCAAGRTSCNTMAATANSLAQANAGSGASAVPVRSGNSVTVTASAFVDYVFAPVIGINGVTPTARGSAGWGAPQSGRAVLPLAFSWCAFAAQTGGGIPTTTTQRTVYLTKSDATHCTGPSGNVVPGGFGWLQAGSGACWANSSTLLAHTYSDPGNSVPSGCSTNDFVRQQNKTVLLPIFDVSGGSGSGAWYRIYAYAAFHITGYSFGGQYKWNAPCSGSSRCIRGYFTVFVEPSEAFTYDTGTPDLGARVVTLTA